MDREVSWAAPSQPLLQNREVSGAERGSSLRYTGEAGRKLGWEGGQQPIAPAGMSSEPWFSSESSGVLKAAPTETLVLRAWSLACDQDV